MVTEEVTAALPFGATFRSRSLVGAALQLGFLALKPQAGLALLGVSGTVGTHGFTVIMLGNLIGGEEGLSTARQRRLLSELCFHVIEEVHNDNVAIAPQGKMSPWEYRQYLLNEWEPETREQWREGMIQTYHARIAPAVEEASRSWPKWIRPTILEANRNFYLSNHMVSVLARDIHLLEQPTIMVSQVVIGKGEEEQPAEAFVRRSLIVTNRSCVRYIKGLEKELSKAREAAA